MNSDLQVEQKPEQHFTATIVQSTVSSIIKAVPEVIVIKH